MNETIKLMDKLELDIHMLNGVRDICMLLESNPQITLQNSTYILLGTVLEKVVNSLQEIKKEISV
jgi:hypothetical protein